MNECRENLYKLWFTKSHCDDHVKKDAMEVTYNTLDRNAKVGKHEEKVHLRRAGSRRVGKSNP